MTANYFKNGDWNVRCQACKKKMKRSELRQRWDGLWVDEKCYEIRNPQEYLKVPPETYVLDLRTPEDPATSLTEVFDVTDEDSTVWQYTCGVGQTIKTLEVSIAVVAASAGTYAIAGHVRDSLTYAAVASVTITLSGDASDSTSTDSGGQFIFTGLADGSYTLTPSKTNVVFTPTSLAVVVDTANQVGLDFLGTQQYTISGTVYESDGVTGVASVSVAWSGDASGSTTTDGSGVYTTSALDPGSYTITPTLTGYDFTAQNQTITSANITGLDFQDAGYSCPASSYTVQTPSQQQQFSEASIPLSAAQGGLRTISSNIDGSRIATGIPAHSTAKGRVNIFTLSGGSYTLTQSIDNPFSSASTAHQFGYAVAMSSDGAYLAIGAYGYTLAGTDGRVVIYKWGGSSYTKIQDFGGSSSGAFGIDLDINGDGSVLVVGSRTTDSAFVFYNVSDVYTEQVQLQPSLASGSTYGTAVAVSGDGHYIAVGDPNNSTDGSQDGIVYIYQKNTGGADNWGEQQVVHSGGGWASTGWHFGSDVAFNCGATYIAIGCSGVDRTAGSAPGGLNEGSMEVWSRSSSTWTLKGAVTQYNDSATTGGGLCGETVAITPDGQTVYMGGSTGDSGTSNAGIIEQANWNGSAYIPAVTEPSSPARALNDHFGKGIALSGDGKILIVGAPDQDTYSSGGGCLFYFIVGT